MVNLCWPVPVMPRPTDGTAHQYMVQCTVHSHCTSLDSVRTLSLVLTITDLHHSISLVKRVVLGLDLTGLISLESIFSFLHFSLPLFHLIKASQIIMLLQQLSNILHNWWASLVCLHHYTISQDMFPFLFLLSLQLCSLMIISSLQHSATNFVFWGCLTQLWDCWTGNTEI